MQLASSGRKWGLPDISPNVVIAVTAQQSRGFWTPPFVTYPCDVADVIVDAVNGYRVRHKKGESAHVG